MRGTRRLRTTRLLALASVITLSVAGLQTGAVAAARTGTPAQAPDQVDVQRHRQQQETVVRYGPYTIEPGPELPDGRHGHAHSGNQFAFGVEKPCENCYLTGMVARLTRTDGSTAGASNNLFLHHMLLFNTDAGRVDATCNPGSPIPLGLLGQRFFASGDERTPIQAPRGYGYRVGTGAWNLIWDLMSTSRVTETVYYEVTFTWVPDTTPGMRDVEPVWFDIDQCGDSQYSIPAGPSERSWTWTVNRPGDMVGVGGHLHDGGVNLTVDNVTTGERICDSVAGYGETPLYVDHHGDAHISSMSTCGGPGSRPIARLTSGQEVRITSHYDVEEAMDDVMGIAVAYVAEPFESTCVRARNHEHVAAGRAWAFHHWAFAVGTGDFLGGLHSRRSLREDPAATWHRVRRC